MIELLVENSDKYNEAVDLNDLIVPLILSFQDTEKGAEQVFKLLEGVTKQIIDKLVSQTGQCGPTRDDMKQEAFLKLLECMQTFRERKCPVFISFWRRALRNHLLSKFKKHKAELVPEPGEFVDHRPDNPSARAQVSEIREVLYQWLSSWKNKKHIVLARDIIDHRILCLEEDRDLHSEIAVRNSISSGFVSQWEAWLRKLILQTFEPQ